MAAFAGTGRLVRLALRRDRVKLAIWIAGIAGIVAASSSALGTSYSTLQERLTYVTTIATSVTGRAFGGTIDGTSLGSIAMVELFIFGSVLLAFMSTLAVIRHTRANEENGSAELIGSGTVGRFASLTAALIVVIGANLVTCALIFGVLSQNNQLSVGGSLGMSIALGLVGIAFGSVAAITAQLSGSSRGANSLASAAIGVAFLLRAIGDGFGRVGADGLSVTPLWPTWLSPLGWGYQVNPFTQQNWWLFGVLAVYIVLMTGFSFVLVAHRDEGLGIFPARKGSKAAARNLLSPLGLAWRLQRGILLGWAVVFAVFGFIAGSMATEFASLVNDNEYLQAYLENLGGHGQLTDIFFVTMFALAGITAVGYGLQALLKLRSEEATGHVESVLGTAVGRVRWMASHAGIALVGVVVLLAIMGLSSGVSYVLTADAVAWNEIWRLLLASLVPLPAVLVLGALTLCVFGLLPRLVIAISWAAFVGCLLISQLGALLELPQWLLNVSPFTHIPNVFAANVPLVPFVVLLSVSLVLILVGAVSFRRRDLTTA